MTIFLHGTQLLTLYTQYAIMNNVDEYTGGIHANNARKVLDAQGVSRTLQGIRGNDKEIHQEEATQGHSHWRQSTSCRYCLARVYQQTQQLASSEAKNVRRLPALTSAKLYADSPGTTEQAMTACTHPFVSFYIINQHKATLVNIVNGIVGGKCVAL